MKLWLVRHGETEANVAGLYSGHAPTALTERGTRQAQTLGKRLQAVPFQRAFCSELERTQRTASLLLGDRNVPSSPSPRSMKCSSATGKCATTAIYSRKMPKTTPHGAQTGSTRRPPTGRASRRLPNAFAALPSPSQFRELDHLLIVGHQGVLSLLVAQLLNMPDSAMWHFPIEHGAWSLVDLQPDFTTLRVLNSQAVWLAEEELRADH